MAIIKKKTWKEGFEKILSGKKTFDARLANFECKPGDILVLEEYDPKAKKYTGRKIEKEITFVLNTKKQKYWTQSDINKEGLQIISFK
jgi:ribosomal protein S17